MTTTKTRWPGIYKRTGARGVKYDAQYRDPDGRQRWKTFPTLDAARRFKTDTEGTVRKGTYVDPHEKATVAAYTRVYVESRAHDQRPPTQARQLSIVATHIEGTRLGGMPLARVRREHVDEWLADRAAVLSRSTLRIVASLLRSTFRYAVENGRLPAAPTVRLAVKPQATAGEPLVSPPSVEEVQRLAAAMPSEVTRALVLVQAGTGMRVSELLALRMCDVSTAFRTVKVTSQLSRTGERVPTKTVESHRTVPMPQAVADVLDGLTPEGTSPDALVFSTRGRPIRQNTYHVQFKAAVERAGLRASLSSHQLRHHYATTLLRAGMSPVAVGRLLGHVDGSLVVRTYAHWMPPDDDVARAALDAAWSARQPDARGSLTAIRG